MLHTWCHPAAGNSQATLRSQLLSKVNPGMPHLSPCALVVLLQLSNLSSLPLNLLLQLPLPCLFARDPLLIACMVRPDLGYFGLCLLDAAAGALFLL